MRPLFSYRESADRFTLTTISETMKQQFGLIKRPWGVYYLKNKTTGEQTSPKTHDRQEAKRLLQAHNESESQPHFNLALARLRQGSAPFSQTAFRRTRISTQPALRQISFSCARSSINLTSHVSRQLSSGTLHTEHRKL